MKQVNYKINIKTEGAEKNVKGLNQDLSSTDKEVKSVNKSGKGLGDTFNKLGISMKAIGTGAVVAGGPSAQAAPRVPCWRRMSLDG